MPPEGLRRFDATELRRFLAAIDASLPGRARVVLLGGSALAVGYQLDTGTTDIDTWETDLAAVQPAAERAREVTGLQIPVGDAGVADAPYQYESRLVRVMPELQHLEVFVLEKHDLALSKIMRCHEGDLAGIQALHRRHGLDRETLVARYMTEMDHAIGDPKRIDLNLQVAVERLYGEAEAAAVGRRLDAWRQRGAR
ncbi:MAG: hypothetical protein JXB32_03525 [Deltaproteobacteria bacterium]|nr:hypothetical protein [Deltaproteobacteria bacterium]